MFHKIIPTSALLAIVVVFVSLISRNSYADFIVDVQINIDSIKDTNGQLNEEALQELLLKAHKERLLEIVDLPTPECRGIEDIRSKSGKNTAALFAIKNKCEGNTTTHIVKETKSPLEAKELQNVKNSDLNELSLRNITPALIKEGLPTLALPDQVLKYTDQNGLAHILIVLPAAPGTQVKDLLMKAKHAVTADDKASALATLSRARYLIGNSFAKLAIRYMEPSGTLGNTYIHHDPNPGNTFIDGSRVIFIDNSGFAKEISNKEHWNNIADALKHSVMTKAFNQQDVLGYLVVPLLKGYVDGYPEHMRSAVIKSLEDVFLISEPEANPARFGDSKFFKNIRGIKLKTVREKYLIPAIGEIKSLYKTI